MTPDELAADRDYARSQYREKMIEHIFIAQMWKEAWFRRDRFLEVLRSEVDASGFDVLLECNGVERHIQLKASLAGGTVRHQKLNIHPAKRRGGCIVWIVFQGNAETGLQPLRFWFFGGGPSEPFPDLAGFKVAKQTKSNMQGVKMPRPAIRVVPRSKFIEVTSTTDLLTRLFGPSRSAPRPAPGGKVSGQ